MEGSKKTVAEYVWPGRITQVIDPHYFWMQLGTRENLYQFEQLQRDMHLFAQQSWAPATSTEELEPGMVVLVDTCIEDMTRWKRGQVAGIMHGNSVDVFYVDYGNTELTTVEKICTNVPTQFKVCPPQAVRCSLAAIKPLVKSWTSRGTKTFQMLTNDRLLSVLVLYGEPGYCEVALYPSAEENGKSVAHCLLAEEVAMPIEDHMVPEFLQDIPTFMAHGYGDTSPYIESPPSTRHDEQKPEADTKVSSTPPSSEKYIPPHQKNQGSSPCSAGSSLTNQSMSVQSSLSTSGQKYSNFPAKPSPQMSQSTTSAGKTKEPVIDFFPFDNVSVYPPSPSSPIKSPTRTGSHGRHEHGHNGSYFSRSPSKYEQYGSSNGYRQGHGDEYSTALTNKGDNRQSHPGRQHERSRFAANFDNLPAPSNTFEPDYMYQQMDRSVENENNSNIFSTFEKTQSESGLQRSPNTSSSSGDYVLSPRIRPRLNIPDSSASQSPFYPPQQKGENTKAWNLTPPHVFEQSHPPPPNLSHELNPPGFYHTHMPPPPLNQSGQYYNQSGPPVSLIKQNSSTGIVSSSPIKVPLQSEFDTRNNHQAMNISSPYHDQYYKDDFRHIYVSPPNVRHTLTDQVNQLNKNSNQIFSRTPVKVTLPSSSKYHGYEPPKMSPESPESPAIAAFNLGDLEYTQMTSTDHFHQRLHQERLQALQEEAEDIARESKEQSELVTISRYGARGQSVESAEDCVSASNNGDIFDQIAQEIQFTSKHSPKGYEELKKSPIRKAGKDKEEYPVKLEGIPQSYIADINFTDAVKEALEFGKTDGMENARALLDGIVESLKLASVEKQLYDVLLLMLTKAVKEYSLYHVIILETINTLNGELEIKDCLARALKRQQELCVRFPTPRQPHHLDCARIMAHIYNKSLDWSDSNASIQDSILVTVEKWIVFNNKGSQIGQVDKENVFLDCFGAFWEVSSTPLVQHNQAFRSRIKDEVRKKLLNENVSRCIRERLLDIMLNLFSLNVEKVDVYTQTVRRTMIPSSCQVTPATCDKATFMASVWQDEVFENINVDNCTEMNWLVNPEYTSPDPVLNLRPGGRGPGPEQKPISLHQDSFYSTKAIDMPNLQDLSIATDKTESFYVTPEDSLVCNTDQEKSKLSELINPITEGKSSILKSNCPDESRKSLAHSIRVKDMETNSAFSDTAEMIKDKDYDNVKDTKIVNQNCKVIHKTTAEQKSATGKSLVDWFDYEPTGADSVRLVDKRLETRKKLEHTSREFMENDVAFKHAPSKDLGRKKSKKEKEREKKMVKAAAGLSTEKLKSGGEKVTEKGEHEIEQHVVCEFQTDANNETVARGNQDDRYAANKVDETIDWWGIGETPDPRYLPGGIEDTLGGNIYIDNGPDVIIEDEFEQAVDESELVNDLETVAILGNVDVASELVGTRDVGENVGESTVKVGDCTSNSSEEQEIVENKLLIRQTGDEFAFDLDDDDEWDSASSEDLNVNSWLGLQQDNPDYLQEFPNTDLKTVVHSKSDIPTLVTEGMLEADESDAKYEKNFPKSNLGDFVKLKDEPEERPQTTRWVPGKRKCHNCHSEDHTTESCKEFVIFQ